MKSWEETKNKIHERLLSSEWQAWEIPRLVKVNAVADLWRTWYADFGDAGSLRCISSVTHKDMQAWGITLDDLEKAAKENDAYNYTVTYIGDIGGTIPSGENPAMYSVSNKDGFFGATGVLNKNIQAKLIELFPTGYYILPFTVCECIIVSNEIDKEELACMLYQVSRTQVEAEERLSDHILQIKDGDLVVVA